jgi:transposase-like protein
VNREWSWYAGDVEVTEPVGREHTMTERKGRAELIDVKELLRRDEDFVRAALQALLQAALEAEMTETIGAEKGERTETRLAYRERTRSRGRGARIAIGAFSTG